MTMIFIFNVPTKCKLDTTKTQLKQMSVLMSCYLVLERDHGFLLVVSLDATGQFLIYVIFQTALEVAKFTCTLTTLTLVILLMRLL